MMQHRRHYGPRKDPDMPRAKYSALTGRHTVSPSIKGPPPFPTVPKSRRKVTMMVLKCLQDPEPKD